MNPLLLATRPKTLIASLSPMAIGTGLALRTGSFTLWVFLFTFLTGLCIQIATNYANDLYDYLKGADTKERKGPTRVTASGLMQVGQMKLATFAIMGFTAVCGSALVYRGGWIIALMTALALLLALGYTTGPFPLSYLGIAEIFVLVFFGPIASGFTYYLQTLSFSPLAFIAGLGPGLISCGLLIINNLRDVEEDKKSSKNTLVARFGIAFGKWEYALALAISSLIPFFLYEKKHPLCLLASLCLLPAMSLIRSVFQNDDPYRYNPLLGETGRLLWLYTFILTMGIIL